MRNIGDDLLAVLDREQVIAGAAQLAQYAIDGLTPAAVVCPSSAEQVAELVRFAKDRRLAVVPCGARTKNAMGRALERYDIALDGTGLGDIAHFDAADLTVSADAGVPIAALNAMLAKHHQFVPLLVPYYGKSTVGGTVSSGVDSPLRQFYGTVRDFLLGAEFVDGTGSRTKSGGRVVKNVTGYDLHKLLVGSQGTLGMITRLNFRTFPLPTAARGFVASFQSMEGALALRAAIQQSPLRPLTLDVLNPGAAEIFATRTPSLPEAPLFAGESGAASGQLAPVGPWLRRREWQLCAAFAGVPEVLERYAQELLRRAEQAGASSTILLDDASRPTVWARLREASTLFREASPSAGVFRLSMLPGWHAEALAVLHAVAEAAEATLACVARATGGLDVALLPRESEAEGTAKLEYLAREVLSAGQSLGGHASVISAPLAVRRLFAELMPAPQGQALMRRVKSAFDPQGLFAPERVLPAI